MCRIKYMTLMMLLKLFLLNYSEASEMNCFPDYEYMDFDEEFHEPMDLLESHFHMGHQQCRHLCIDMGNCRYVKYDRTQLKCDLFGTDDYEFEEYCDNFYLDSRNLVCWGLFHEIVLHSGETICYEDRLQNIAFGASGYPSSTPADGYSFSYAVDGITDDTGLVAGTGYQFFPYLVLDLGKPFAVDRVEIYGSDMFIIHDIEVRVGMTDNWESMEFCHYFGGYYDEKIEGSCDYCLTGQYVIFKIVPVDSGSADILAVKELKVYGR